MTGTVVLSMEIELGWGLARLPIEPEDRHSQERVRETETLERLLTVCDDLELPITFDVVGHLFESACDGTHDGPTPADWFADDPGTDVETDPLFYAPDLIEQIRAANVDHEIATHTFSHVRCDQVDDEVLSWELDEAARAHERAGFGRPASLVPPMHGPPNPAVVRDAGITGVREPVTLRPPVAERSPPDSTLGALAWRVTESHPAQVLLRSHPIAGPELDDGVVRHPTTWHASLTAPFLPNGTQEPSAVFRALPTRLRQAVHKRYLRRALDDAASAESYCHLWTHLFNLSNDAQFPPVQSFLERLAARRDDGDVTVETMASVSAEVRGDDG